MARMAMNGIVWLVLLLSLVLLLVAPFSLLSLLPITILVATIGWMIWTTIRIVTTPPESKE